MLWVEGFNKFNLSPGSKLRVFPGISDRFTGTE